MRVFCINNTITLAIIPGLERKKAHVYIAMPTVDAFKVQKRRKRNLWENKYTEKDINEKFRSIVLKSPPLTEDEHFDLDKGWTVYRFVFFKYRNSTCLGLRELSLRTCTGLN